MANSSCLPQPCILPKAIDCARSQMTAIVVKELSVNAGPLNECAVLSALNDTSHVTASPCCAGPNNNKFSPSPAPSTAVRSRSPALFGRDPQPPSIASDSRAPRRHGDQGDLTAPAITQTEIPHTCTHQHRRPHTRSVDTLNPNGKESKA